MFGENSLIFTQIIVQNENTEGQMTDGWTHENPTWNHNTPALLCEAERGVQKYLSKYHNCPKIIIVLKFCTPNRADPDQTAQGLHCLSFHLVFYETTAQKAKFKLKRYGRIMCSKI